MAFGIPVVCTPDAPNGWRALRWGHWDISSCPCQHARLPVGVFPASAQASGSDIRPFNQTVRRSPAARALSCHACALARRHDGTDDPSNLWLLWWNVPRGVRGDAGPGDGTSARARGSPGRPFLSLLPATLGANRPVPTPPAARPAARPVSVVGGANLPRARPAAARPMWHGCGSGVSPPLARGADRPRRARMSQRRAKPPARPTALSPKPLQLVWRARRSQRPSAGHQRGALGAARSAPECRDTLPAPCPPADCPHGGTRVSLGPRMPQEAVRRPQRPRC